MVAQCISRGIWGKASSTFDKIQHDCGALEDIYTKCKYVPFMNGSQITNASDEALQHIDIRCRLGSSSGVGVCNKLTNICEKSKADTDQETIGTRTTNDALACYGNLCFEKDEAATRFLNMWGCNMTSDTESHLEDAPSLPQRCQKKVGVEDKLCARFIDNDSSQGYIHACGDNVQEVLQSFADISQLLHASVRENETSIAQNAQNVATLQTTVSDNKEAHDALQTTVSDNKEAHDALLGYHTTRLMDIDGSIASNFSTFENTLNNYAATLASLQTTVTNNKEAHDALQTTLSAGGVSGRGDD